MIAVSAGYKSSYTVASDNTVYAWGQVATGVTVIGAGYKIDAYVTRS